MGNMSAYDFDFEDIDGKPLALAGFVGKPLLVVNTASECGFTPQYADLQKLWLRYRDKGLVVLGVPSNDFGNQEPGDEIAIKVFCQNNYKIDFPMARKQKVIGADAHPFYRWVVEEVGEAAAPKWNFHKYLIAPDGSLAGLWPSKISPLDPEITDTIDSLLVA
ncbi:MAG: glutathione peroxidase [Acidiferrobacterales bacterium]